MSAFIILYYVFINVLHLPAYAVALIFTAAFLALIFIFRAGFLAGMAAIYYRRGKRDKARKFYRLSFKNKSKNPLTYLNYAIMQVNDGDGETALEYANKALAMNPNVLTEKNAYLTIGSARWVMGDVPGAIEALEGMIKKFDYVNGYVFSTLGYLYIADGKLDKARETTEKALAEDPQSASAWDNLGQIYVNEKNLEKAEEAFLKAVSIRNDLVDSLYFLGIIYENRGDTEKAEEYFIRAHKCKISKLNTVTVEQVLEKYNKYKPY